MSRIYKKAFAEESVYEAALSRFRQLFDNFDKVVISFSGGKDSTVCLNLGLQVAREKGKLPLDVYFWDEEAIHPETVEYVERVRKIPDVRLKWLCVPIQHRNACSRSQPYWHPWNPDEKDKWVRDLPDNAITELQGFWWGATVPDMCHLIYGDKFGTIADVRGIRADESLRRYQSVSMKLKDNWIAGARNGYFYPCSPIYDWTTLDVWTGPRLYGWDYNRAYDLFSMVGIAPSDQRVCPPFGEEPLESLWMYSVIWPDLWHKMINRVPGAATAARYAKSELYGYGKIDPPPGMTWREWTYSLLELYPPKLRKVVSQNLASIIKLHKNKTNKPIHETEADPISGVSWKFLANIANRGDLKGRRVQGLTAKANAKLKGRYVADNLAVSLDADTRY